ncbi:MAG: type VI secretion system contractile sheath large subunit [Xanthomonadales bacterium]|nr:type VI secretion system contractile sheath large subunit [Xanthomonadales bacterium]
MSRLELELGRRSGGPAAMDESLTLFVLGDFGGEKTPAPGFHVASLERLDAVMRSVGPSVEATGLPPLECFDDLHPDRICERIPQMAELLKLLRQVDDPACFDQAVADLTRLGIIETPDRGDSSGPPDPETDATESDDATLERLLGQPSGQPSAGRAGSSLSRMIETAVEAHVVKTDASRLGPELKRQLENQLSERLGKLMHQQSFQGLEARWRSLFWLLANVDTGSEVEVFLADIGDDTLCGSGPDLKALKRQMAEMYEGTSRTRERSLVLADFEVGQDPSGLALARALSGIGHELEIPVFAGACPKLMRLTEPDHSDEESERWASFRRETAAQWLILAFPRVLLRLPYGAETDPIESFRFEEVGGHLETANLLWGNGAYVCAILHAQALLGAEGSAELEVPALTTSSDRDLAKLITTRSDVYRLAAEVQGLGLVPILPWKNRPAVSVPAIRAVGQRAS